jgi:ribosomal 30S subunit maturation factor RimM
MARIKLKINKIRSFIAFTSFVLLFDYSINVKRKRRKFSRRGQRERRRNKTAGKLKQIKTRNAARGMMNCNFRVPHSSFVILIYPARPV